jgi:NAD+ kinase
MKYKSIACVADNSEKAQDAYKSLSAKYKFTSDDKADAILALGGDGFMLHILHKYMDSGKPIYGMNCGTVGFLMNEYREADICEHINNAGHVTLHPLRMTAKTKDGKEHHALALNEVSMFRQSKQAANLRISVDGNVRLEELISDGVLVTTPAGSTAYNLSAQGPILPLTSDILALTPISPFRPRRWRGALLSHKAIVKIEVLDSEKRPVSAVADFTEVRDVVSVEVLEERSKGVKLLFDPGHSLEERIIREQFLP